jgi:hypothetical protein
MRYDQPGFGTKLYFFHGVAKKKALIAGLSKFYKNIFLVSVLIVAITVVVIATTTATAGSVFFWSCFHYFNGSAVNG